MAGKMMTFGIILCSRSITLTDNKTDWKKIARKKAGVNPYQRKLATKISEVTASTKGYLIGIGVLQKRHLPFKAM